MEEGVPRDLLAKQHKVAIGTVRRIKQNAMKLREHSESLGAHTMRRIRKPQLEDLDARLYAWVQEERANGGRITDTILQEKAKELNALHGGPSDFTASRGWAWRFKTRHNINPPKPRPEKPDLDAKKIEEFIENLLRLMEEDDIEMENVYSIAEIGIMWKALPPRVSLSAGEKKSQLNRMQKERVSVGFCVNATGIHKLTPLFIYRYAQPQALKHCWDRVPVIFKAQKHGSMVDRELFVDWLENHFLPAVRKEQLEKGYAAGKVLLLVDDSLSNVIPPKVQSTSKVEILFFPRNTTSRVQPMYQGVASYIRKSFRLLLLRRILNFSKSVKEFFEDYDLKDCIDMVHEAWSEVTSTSLRNSWQKIFKDRLNEPETDECAGFNKTLAIRDAMCRMVRDDIRLEEIQSWLSHCEKVEEYLLGFEEREEGQKKLKLLTKEAMDKSFDNLLVWAKKQADFLRLDVHMLEYYYNQSCM